MHASASVAATSTSRAWLEPSVLELEQALLPRDAFFAPVEHVPAERASGRIAAEMISPYPPGAS